MIWPFPAKGCCPFRRWTWRFIMTITLLIDFKKLLWWLQWVSHLSDFDYSARLEEPWMFSDSPAVQVKLRPCAGYMFLIMEVENWHSKTTFVWSQKERIALCIFNHTLTTKSNLTPQKIDAWVEFWLKYHHSSWCPSLLISGHQPQLPPAVVLALRPHWLRRWRPRPTSPKKGHAHEPHRAKRTSWVGEGYIEKTCASNHILWNKSDRFQNVFSYFLGVFCLSDPKM